MAVQTIYWRYSVFKNWLAAGGTAWVNTYEATTFSPTTVSDDIHSTIANLLGDYERQMHVPQAYFDRVVISSWTDDSTPYDVTALKVIPLGYQGLRDPGAFDVLDLNAVLKVRRNPPFGRPGKIAYRGVLLENDINASAAGFWQLLPGSPLAPGGTVWASAVALIAPLLAGGDLTGEAQLAMISKSPANTGPIGGRVIDSLVPVGAGFNQLKKKFFNRKTTIPI